MHLVEPIKEAVFAGEGVALAVVCPHGEHLVLGAVLAHWVVGVELVLPAIDAEDASVLVGGALVAVHGDSFQKGMDRMKASVRTLRVVRVRRII